MNEDMKLKQDYKETFAEIHASEALAGKVKNMAELEKRKAGFSGVKKWAVTAAAVAVLFAGSNGVVYAATGSTWFQAMVVRLNGTEYQVDMEAQKGEDDLITYSGVIEQEDGSTAIMITGEEEIDEIFIDVTTPEVLEENDKVYLVDGEVKIDITQDVEDGKATGSYVSNGVTMQYEIDYMGEEWSISVSDCIEE